MPCCSIANDLSVACTVHPEVVFFHDRVLARLVSGLLFRRGVLRNTRCTLVVRIDRNGLGRERYSDGISGFPARADDAQSCSNGQRHEHHWGGLEVRRASHLSSRHLRLIRCLQAAGAGIACDGSL
jgi:hypothetical protein